MCWAVKGMMMKTVMISALVAAVSLTACVSQPETTRSANFVQAEVPNGKPTSKVRGADVLGAQFNVVKVEVDVPTTLRVSEANSYKPAADIVWHGDPLGDRYEQVKAIFENALKVGTETMHKGPKVIVRIEVTKFHALTQRTRYTIGGVHAMRFVMSVVDAKTGAVLMAPRNVVADVRASGGPAAIAEDEAGRTQKVVVTEQLVSVIRRELSNPAETRPKMAAFKPKAGAAAAASVTQ